MKKVLIVDDDRDAAELVARYIASLNYAAEIALSGAEALDRLQGEAFDMVISDVRMSNGSGIDLLRVVKQSKMEIPVLLMSADAKAVKAQAKAMKADFIAKPLTKESLSEAVRRLESTSQPSQADAHPYL